LKRQDQETTNRQVAVVVSQNLETLAGYGVIPSYANSREVAALPHVTPELIGTWGDHLQRQATIRNLPGLLLNTLRVETEPPSDGQHISEMPPALGGVYQ